MEPVTIAIISITVFGVLGLLTAFIRQLLVSRDKKLNDEANLRALKEETDVLDKLRQQMIATPRFSYHYQVIDHNKDALLHIEARIEDIFQKKLVLIERYSKIARDESQAMIQGKVDEGRKHDCEMLKMEIDEQLKFYENELNTMQAQRNALWGNHKDLDQHLIAQEAARNKSLDELYHRHSILLEKIYLRHNENAEEVATQGIKATTSTLHDALVGPLTSLMAYFKKSGAVVDTSQADKESEARKKVEEAKQDLDDSFDASESDALPEPEKTSGLRRPVGHSVVH